MRRRLRFEHLLAVVALAGAARADTLRVRVLDPDGQPAANVPLAVRSALVGGHVEPGEATTGVDGVATFEGAERWWTPEARAQVPQVEINLPLDQTVAFSLLQKQIPREPLTLRLPPGVPLEVVVWRPEDGDPTWTRLALEWTDPTLGAIRRCVCGAITEERQSFCFPPLGRASLVGLVFLPGAGAAETGSVAPAASWSPLQTRAPEEGPWWVAVLLSQEHVLLTGRALQAEDRAPVADFAPLLWRSGHAGVHIDEWYFACDGDAVETRVRPDGRFEALFRDERARLTNGGLLQVEDLVHRDPERADVRWARIQPRHPRSSRVFDFETVLLERKPLGLFGQVVDASGAPIAGAWVRPVDKANQEPHEFDPETLAQRSPIGDHTGATGRFAIVDPLATAPDRLKVLVTAPDHYSRSITVRAEDAARPQVFRLVAPVDVHGDVVGYSGERLQKLIVEHRYVDGARSWIGDQPADRPEDLVPTKTPVDDSGRFRVERMRPGAALFRVLAPDGTLLASQRVQIGPDGPAEAIALDVRPAGW